MHENFTCENREVLSAPERRSAGRLEKDVIQKSNMHVDGKSDGRVLPCSRTFISITFSIYGFSIGGDIRPREK